MSRISCIKRDNFTAAQKKLCERITSGKRSKEGGYDSFFTETGALRGPFNAYLHSPVIGEAAQRLGEAVRFKSSIPAKLREIAILTVAANLKAQYEWWAHERIGRQQGINECVIRSIKAGEQPHFESPAEASVFAFCQEMLDKGCVSDLTYTESVELLGESGVVELVILVGYYLLVAMILNVFEVPIPDG